MDKIITILILFFIGVWFFIIATTNGFSFQVEILNSTPNYSNVPYITQECRNETVLIQNQDNSTLGTLIGGVAGGVAGSTVGKGKGNTLAILGGTLLGGAVGNSIGKSHGERYETRNVCRDVTKYRQEVQSYNIQYRVPGSPDIETVTKPYNYSPGLINANINF